MRNMKDTKWIRIDRPVEAVYIGECVFKTLMKNFPDYYAKNISLLDLKEKVYKQCGSEKYQLSDWFWQGIADNKIYYDEEFRDSFMDAPAPVIIVKSCFRPEFATRLSPDNFITKGNPYYLVIYDSDTFQRIYRRL